MTNRAKHFGRRERHTRPSRLLRFGAAAVEFAVVAPLFLLLLAGILEFGQAFRIEHILSSASRRGARVAVLESATNSAVEDVVKARCTQTLNVQANDLMVVISVNGNPAAPLESAQTGDEITVTVSVAYSKAATGFFTHMFANTSLSSDCTMEHE